MKKQKQKRPQSRATAPGADSQTAALKTANSANDSKPLPPSPVNNALDADIQESESKEVPLSTANGLSPEQQERLAELERIIEEGLPTWLKVCCAMAAIKAEELYSPHRNFHSYCLERWHLAKSTSYAYAKAGHAYQLIESSGEDCLPENEAQLRPLLDLDDDKIVEVWSEAVKLADKGGLTQGMVQKARKMVVESPARKFDLKEKTLDLQKTIRSAWDKWPAEERPYLIDELVGFLVGLGEELRAEGGEVPESLRLLAIKKESVGAKEPESDNRKQDPQAT